MKNRRNILAILKWKHRDGTLVVSWPWLHYLSIYARGAIACMLICPPLALVAFAYVEDVPYGHLLNRAASISPPPWLILAITLPIVVVFLDFVLRNQFRISPNEVAFRRPWGSARIWPRNRLVGVQCDTHQISAGSHSGPSTIGIVYVMLRDDDGVRERVEVGGSMHQGTAEELVTQIGFYTKIRPLRRSS